MTDRSAAIAAIAAELVALPPSDFTRARDARARQSVADDPDLAREIRLWKRPSVAAWAVNALVREAPDEIAEALALATELREAQDDLDAKALSALNRQRRSLVAGLARRAESVAEDFGVRVSPAARSEVERTLNAAMRDARAGEAVRSGRLVRALDASGLDPADLAGAVIGGDADVVAPPAVPRDDLAERRARREAERERAAAERERTATGRDLDRAERDLERATERAALLADRVKGLERDLARVRTDADAAAQARDQARSARDAAASTAHGAAERARSLGLPDSS